MARISVATVLSEFKRVAPQCTDAEAKLLLNEVHSDLMALTGFKRFENTAPLVGGERFVTLFNANSQPYSVRQINHVAYRYRQGNRVIDDPLEPTTEAKLDATMPGWENLPLGVPRMFFIVIDGALVNAGLVPAPLRDTVNGFPAIYWRGHADIREPLGNDPQVSLSPLITSFGVYVYGMAARFFSSREPERSQMYWSLYEKEKRALAKHASTLVRGVRDRIDVIKPILPRTV